MKRFFPFAISALVTTSLWAAEKDFTFIHISDAHVGSANHAEQLQIALEDIEKNFPEAEFIVNSGDVTEFGLIEEFEDLNRVLKKSKKKIINTSGNHDVRWSPSGKENYRNYIGDTYQQFEHKGINFIMMDTSMLIEHYGHFDGQQIDKLTKSLDSLPKDTPAILMVHHAPVSPSNFIDNEYQFAEMIKKYNVPLIGTGHGHTFQRYSYNGTTYAQGGSVSTKGGPAYSYRIYKVKGDKMESFTRRYDKNLTVQQETIDLTPRKFQELKVKPSAQTGVFEVTLGSNKFNGSANVQLDQVTSAGETIKNGIININTDLISAGIHQLSVSSADDNGTTVIGTVQFESTTAANPETSITRRWKLLSGNQAHPTVDGDVLYIGANDGFLRAVDLKNSQGEFQWETNLNREILSSPVITESNVIVGSMDTHVYSLNKKTGKIDWKFKTNQAILASPLVVNDTVYIGSGDEHMYALDLKTGKEKWRFKSRKFIKMTPAFKNDRLFFGAWDNYFYCLDANSGKLIWETPVSTAVNGHFSAATSNPVLTDNGIIFCSHDYTVRCLAQSSGGTIWTYKPKKDELGPSYSTAVIKDGVAYFGSISGHVVGHDVETGEKVFNVNVRPHKKDDLFDSIPTLYGDNIYVGSVGGNLYSVNIPNKKVEWSVALQPGFIFTKPVVWNNKVYVGTLNNMVYEISH